MDLLKTAWPSALNGTRWHVILFQTLMISTVYAITKSLKKMRKLTVTIDKFKVNDSHNNYDHLKEAEACNQKTMHVCASILFFIWFNLFSKRQNQTMCLKEQIILWVYKRRTPSLGKPKAILILLKDLPWYTVGEEAIMRWQDKCLYQNKNPISQMQVTIYNIPRYLENISVWAIIHADSFGRCVASSVGVLIRNYSYI